MANKQARRTFGLNMFMFFRLFISHLYAEMESRELGKYNFSRCNGRYHKNQSGRFKNEKWNWSSFGAVLRRWLLLFFREL